MYPGAHLEAGSDRPAVIMATTGETVSFAELEANSIRIARLFLELGLQRGDNVAVLTTNSPRVFDLYWAAMRSGLYITMVNWHLTAAEAAYIVEDCGAKTLVVDAALGEMATELSGLTPGIEHRLSIQGTVLGYADLDEAAARQSCVPLADQPRGADMLYSSGTTGRPKGIKPPLPDRQIGDPGDTVTTTYKEVWGVSPGDVYLSPAPLYHAGPLRVCAAIQALGGTVVVMDRFDAEKTLEYIEKYRVTHSQWVPTMFVRLLRLPEETRRRYDLSSMRIANHAAAPCPIEIKRQMIDWWGPIIFEYYSSTEMNGSTIVNTEDWLRKPGTVGRAALGVLHICGANGNELPAGEIGSIYFERDELPFQYHNDPDKTRAAQHPDHPTWTTTGDVGYVDADGYLFLTDRDSFMIISGGVNIYPQEIENLLIEHPKVLDAGVIGIPDEDMGELVTAMVKPIEGVHGDDALAAELLEHLRGRIAKYKVPRRIIFIDDMPRTMTGKLIKRDLVQQAVRVPGEDHPE
ncbi:acyl-CoA synthetase [Rhodococcus sp. B50]|uniref:acyl-CoA synthetase n=1 Tax=Rhodococcus sp. B50 TaxID=2682847 RepID=UPI001BD645B9|nr:acyl-CoA synthetase [Rhodococcus sp. B50]MBS9376020.1 Long-chain-fatty-acid--CoA ligase [Rhodococcus sp. B50]